MARMSIDDKLLRDPRAIQLARRFGWRRQEAIGRLIDVYSVAYDRERDVLRTIDIDIAAEQEGFAEAMIDADLAERVASGVRIKGAKKRIEYLSHKSKAGRDGGLKSAETRKNVVKQTGKHTSSSGGSSGGSTPQAAGNPIPSVPDVVPDPDPVLVPDPVPPPDQIQRETCRPATRAAPTADHGLVIAVFDARFTERYKTKPTWGPKPGKLISSLLKQHTADEIIRRIGILFDAPPAFLALSPADVSTLAQHFDKLAAPSVERTAVQRVQPKSAFELQMERVEMLRAQEAAEREKEAS